MRKGMNIKNAVWQKTDTVVSSKVALAIFALISYAEVYLSVAESFFEANRLLFGTSFFALLMLALQGRKRVVSGFFNN